jgi:hypothetical protein
VRRRKSQTPREEENFFEEKDESYSRFMSGKPILRG